MGEYTDRTKELEGNERERQAEESYLRGKVEGGTIQQY
jgi:hypothetical protein